MFTSTIHISNTICENRVTVTDVSAIKDVDYSVGTPLDVTFEKGELVKVLMFPIEDDQIVEDTEAFKVTLTSDEPGVTIQPDTATVFILDNDAVVMVTTQSVSIREDGAKAVINLERVGDTSVPHTVK
ncbi:predicted protein [Nematostella vectensis]|uniref:Calx-beta domain-containing protein n=1 Tax=Nematostella vectensis TaxID=45351 RepID=A7SSS2_NEMVE|nr:predicted protein [Nematostella vectensis]|eukprot:XP_001625344.1 predicted protein [Nematostella vectensis]